jgi:hypothetical protein
MGQSGQRRKRYVCDDSRQYRYLSSADNGNIGQHFGNGKFLHSDIRNNII